jgi:microcystin-dependent protein
MSDAFIGSIVLFAGNFAPRGWAFCEGQLLPISNHQALFSILGTTYGGDGRTTFALPDLRGRVPLHPGNGMGLTARRLGETGGTESNHLTVAGVHTHKEAGPDTVFSNVLKATSGELPNLPPFGCINFIICMEGVFPSRA